MTRQTMHAFVIAVVWSVSCPAAELRCAKISTDHYVLQGEMPLPVWGWAKPDSQVTLKFADQEKTVRVDGNGKWLLGLDPIQANYKSRELAISSTGQSVTLKDVVAGDVSLAGGQSNIGCSIPKASLSP